MVKSLSMLILLASMTVACNNFTTPPINTPPFQTAQTTSTVTRISPTASSTPEASPTRSRNIINRCVEIQTGETPIQYFADGTIMDWEASPKTLTDLRKGTQYLLPHQMPSLNIYDSQESPNKGLLAYLERVRNDSGDFTGMILWVVDSRADVKTKMTFSRNDLNHLRWLDNENIAFYTEYTPQVGSILVVNRTTGEQRIIRNELPDFSPQGPDLGGLHGDDWWIEYSPDLQWGIYVTKKGTENTYEEGSVLRDFTNGSIVWETNEQENETPQWSPDGNILTYSDGIQFFLIDRSGNVKTLSSNNNLSPVLYKWSPNGNYLVFWSHANLMLYDYRSDVLMDLCYHNNHNGLSRFLWSPDSSKIVFDIYLDDGAVLVDLQNNRAYQLTKILNAYYPSIWLNSIP